jgi:predicted dienelactone hydrolase
MGDYWVGYGTDSITYVRAPDDTERTIKVAFWYPSRRTTGGTLARYTGVLARRGEGVRVRQGLELAREDGPFPLLIFSHGNAGLAEQNFFMTEHFASHGWIVASVEHTNNSITDTDGSINFRSAIDRPQDMSALLDWLEGLPAGHILADTMTDDVVMSGHSFGGLTTLANAGATFPVEMLESACANEELDRRICELFNGDEDVQALFAQGFLDERIKVAIPQAPASGQVYQDGTSAITMPTLMFTGGKDRSLPNAEDGDVLWGAMVGEQHMRVDVLRGGHFTFSNMCDILPGIELTVTDGCSEEFIDPPLAYDLINHYSLAFAYHHLYGDDSYDDLLNGEVEPYAGEVVVSRKSAEQ